MPSRTLSFVYRKETLGKRKVKKFKKVVDKDPAFW